LFILELVGREGMGYYSNFCWESSRDRIEQHRSSKPSAFV
jgi:hypothetical protein